MESEPELLESSLLYHGTYLLDELRREQQMSSEGDLSEWFQSHLPYTIAPKSVFCIYLAPFLMLNFVYVNQCMM